MKGPEICESKPYGRASDVWSMGVILFELAALEMPFQAPSLPLLIHRICNTEPDYVKKVEENYSKNLVEFIKSMLHKNPDKRPSVKEIIKTEFVKGHISKLLSYTIKVGTGGVEAVLYPSILEKKPNVNILYPSSDAKKDTTVVAFPSSTSTTNESSDQQVG